MNKINHFNFKKAHDMLEAGDTVLCLRTLERCKKKGKKILVNMIEMTPEEFTAYYKDEVFYVREVV